MSEENKLLIRRWFDEVWNQGRADAIPEMLAEEVVLHGLSGDPTKPLGLAEFQAFHAQFREAFPNIKVVVEDTIAEGDKVVARCTVTGSHAGDSLGFKATNADVEFTGVGIGVVKNGKFVEVWDNYDFMKMYRQLGLVQNF